MLPTHLLVPSAQTALRMRSWFPPFANCAKGEAAPCVAHASEIKGWTARLREGEDGLRKKNVGTDKRTGMVTRTDV